MKNCQAGEKLPLAWINRLQRNSSQGEIAIPLDAGIYYRYPIIQLSGLNLDMRDIISVRKQSGGRGGSPNSLRSRYVSSLIQSTLGFTTTLSYLLTVPVL